VKLFVTHEETEALLDASGYTGEAPERARQVAQAARAACAG